MRRSTLFTRLLLAAGVAFASLSAAPTTPVEAAGGYWGARTAAANNSWRAITYGNGLFVAVSDNGTDRVMSSPDGITWASHATVSPDKEWKSVTYGNGTFVAVGYNGVMTSANGTSWTVRSAPNKKGEVRYLNGQFIALSWENQSDHKPIMTSNDGITWTERTMSPSAGAKPNEVEQTNGEGLAYGNGTYIAMGISSQTRLAAGTDGATWTALVTPFGSAAYATWWDIIFANGKFLMVGQNAMSTSTDGTTWTAVTGDVTRYSWTSVVYADNKFVAVDGSGQKKVATSTDGVTWTILDVDLAMSASYSSITFGNGAFVGVANSGMGAETLVLFSNSDQAPAPTITSVSPASLTAGTTSNITITGTGFRTGLSVTFGGVACSSPIREASTRVSCRLPSGVTGVVDVVVTNSDGQSATLAGGLTVTERTSGAGATPTPTTTTTTTTAPSTTAPAGSDASVSYENAVPGVTKTDTKVYTTPPTQVAASSAINVLTASQNRTLDVETRTPDVCVPNDDELVFLDEGRCVSAVVNATTRKVVRVLRTTVVDDAVSELRVGNAVVVLAPIYFDFVSAQLDARAIARLRAIAPRASAAGSILVVGHSGTLNGNSPENVKLSQDRARNTVNALRRVGAKGPFFAVGLGALDPARADKTESAQAKNRRVVIVLVP